ncbi:MAG: stage II sporulation protein M [Pseudomonadota bacterium]
MSPAEFVARHEAEWSHLERLLHLRAPAGEKTADGKPVRHDTRLPADFPALYRRACRHLALATERRYPQDIVDRLNALALAGQQALYRPETRLWSTIAAFLAGGFAAHVRRRARVFWLAFAIFYLPLIGCTLASWQSPQLVYSLLAPENVADFEAMYDADRRVIGYLRDDDENLMMFGYYIRNNIGIGFQTFAGGIFAGIGSLFILFYNGTSIGMVAGYLTARGHGETFWQFVCGHSAFELNAIVLCGMAGLMLGHALIAPGRYRRAHAMTHAARDAVPILYGAAFMLFVAAIVEAFWSSRTVIPPPVKYAVAAFWWLLVAVYFLRAGRQARDAS